MPLCFCAAGPACCFLYDLTRLTTRHRAPSTCSHSHALHSWQVLSCLNESVVVSRRLLLLNRRWEVQTGYAAAKEAAPSMLERCCAEAGRPKQGCAAPAPAGVETCAASAPGRSLWACCGLSPPVSAATPLPGADTSPSVLCSNKLLLTGNASALIVKRFETVLTFAGPYSMQV